MQIVFVVLFISADATYKRKTASSAVRQGGIWREQEGKGDTDEGPEDRQQQKDAIRLMPAMLNNDDGRAGAEIDFFGFRISEMLEKLREIGQKE